MADYIHKFETKKGPAFVISRSPNLAGVTTLGISSYIGSVQDTGKADRAISMLNSIKKFVKKEEGEKPEEKQAVVSVADRIRDFASFLIPKE